MNDDLPFGGVGPSGMGHYHGKEGFINFSKSKGVLVKGRFNTARLLSQPWDGKMFQLVKSMMLFRFKHNLY
jgi:coniferyl-aldehyde dehydrogenase